MSRWRWRGKNSDPPRMPNRHRRTRRNSCRRRLRSGVRAGTTSGAARGRVHAACPARNCQGPRAAHAVTAILTCLVRGSAADRTATSNADGGLKPGELAAAALGESSCATSAKEEDEPYSYCTPMSVPRTSTRIRGEFVQSVTAKGTGTIYVIHENGDAGAVRKVYHGRPQASACRRSCFRPGGDTRSAAGKATRWSSTPSATTTSSGSTAAARRTPSSCTPSSGGRAPATARLINEFTLDDPGALDASGAAEVHGARLAAGDAS